MNQIVIIGTFEIHADDAAAAAELMRVMMNETVKERGCLHYAYASDLATPNRFQLSELWESDMALAAHFNAEHMATYRAGMGKLKVERRSVKRYDVANAKDL